MGTSQVHLSPPRARLRFLATLFASALALVAWALPTASNAAGITVRIDWDNYAAPDGNTGNVTANVAAYFRRVYSQFTSITLVTAGPANLIVSVLSDNKANAYGWSPIGTGPARVYGGALNEDLVAANLTDHAHVGSAIGHTLAHEVGHALGLGHNATTSMVMVDGGLLTGGMPQRAGGLPDGFTAGEAAAILNTTKAGKALPGQGRRLSTALAVAAVRGVGDVLDNDDHLVDVTTQIVGSSQYSLGWVNETGEFFQYGAVGAQPANMSLYPGTQFLPALRHNITGQVFESGPGQPHSESNNLPPNAALQPPQSSNYSSLVIVQFPSLGADVRFDAGQEFGQPSPFGNGLVADAMGPLMPMFGPWVLVLLMAGMAIYAARTIRRSGPVATA